MAMRYNVETENGIRVMSKGKLFRYFLTHDTERIYGSRFTEWLWDMEKMGLIKRRVYD